MLSDYSFPHHCLFTNLTRIWGHSGHVICLCSSWSKLHGTREHLTYYSSRYTGLSTFQTDSCIPENELLCLSDTSQVWGIHKNSSSPHSKACHCTDKVRTLKLHNMQTRELFSCCFYFRYLWNKRMCKFLWEHNQNKLSKRAAWK